MGLFSLAKLFAITLRESANDGSDFTNPDADFRRLFLGEDGALHLRDSAGAVTDIGGSGSLTVEDEGTPLATSATTLDFVGAGVTASGTGAEKTITIPGDAAGTIQTFTPTWTGSSSNPTLSNGTITGHYQKLADKLYWFCIVLTYGSSSSAGTGFYSFGNLPFTVKTTSPVEQVVTAQVRDTGTTRFDASGTLTAGATSVGQVIVGDATGSRQFSGTVPVTLATGDTCVIQGVVVTD